MTTTQTIDGVLVSRGLLERLLSDACNENWSDLNRVLNAPTACQECMGTGGIGRLETCKYCKGTGRIAQKNPLLPINSDKEPTAWDVLTPNGSWCKTVRGRSTAEISESRGFKVIPLYAGQSAPAAVVQKYDETLLPFVALMRNELHANAGKGDRPGWLSMSADTCMLEIFYHVGKLQKAVKKGEGMAEYAADVANMCMMLLDICGALSFVEQPAPVAPTPINYGALDPVERLAVCRGEVAPVAVVLPERMSLEKAEHHTAPVEIHNGVVTGWNACLDEVTRLNEECKPCPAKDK